MENTIVQATAAPFYFNYAFWAVVFAAIAIILSQIKPLYLLFKKAKLDIELYSRILVAHKIGNPNLQCHVVLNNLGGKNLKIKKCSAKIERDGVHIVTLPAQNYNTDVTGDSTRLFTKFTLKTGTEWGNIINFVNFFNRTEEKNCKEAESLLKEDILKKLDAEPDKKKVVSAEDSLVKPFLDIFESMFIWKPGEYKLIITVSAEPLKEEIIKQYRFTLFETDSNNLREYTKDYATGAGIYFDTTEKHPGIAIQITEEG